MRDYDIRFRLQWLLKDTVEGDLLKGRLSMDGKDIALRQADIDSIADALSDLDGDWSYDEMPNNLDGEWRLVVDGALPMDKFGEDLPPELRIIVDILIGYAMENDLTRAFGTLVAIRDLERSNPSEEYIRWFRDMPEGRLDHDTALRLMSEAREDPMIERSQTVAERVMIDLLEQHGCKDIVDAWRFRLRGPYPPMAFTTLSDFSGDAPEWDGEFEVVRCGRALGHSGLPGVDLALNPYGGCEHGCVYCYAMQWTHRDPSTWRVVRVRSNIASRLAKELDSIEGTVGIGTVTDPYQAAEARFRLTRSCLEVLASKGRKVQVLTKSDLVLRDIDILGEMDVRVGLSITTLDDRVSLMTEPGAPLPPARLKALSVLNDAGIPTFALVSPLMSSMEGKEAELLDAILETGVRRVECTGLHPESTDPSGMARLERMRIHQSPSAVDTFRRLCIVKHGAS